MDPNAGPSYLVNTAQLSFTDGTHPFQCPDIDEKCWGIYPLNPAYSPDPTWPPPYIVNNGQLDVSRFLALT
jgi:hypothetical protein